MTQPLEQPRPASMPLDRLSALVDGELGSAEAGELTEAWRREAGLRASWHAYQMIGDVLRSEDLACHPECDETFLQQIRVRLDAEPTLIAPAPAIRRAAAWRTTRWQRPVAVAAGFAAVAGVTFVLQTGGGTDAPARLAASPGQPLTVVSATAPVHATTTAPRLVTDSKLIRDAKLDRYLAAHRPFSLGGPLGVPVGAVRNADMMVPDR